MCRHDHQRRRRNVTASIDLAERAIQSNVYFNSIGMMVAKKGRPHPPIMRFAEVRDCKDCGKVTRVRLASNPIVEA